MSNFSRYFENIPPVTKNLLIINLLVYVVMAIAPGGREAVIERYCALHSFQSPLFNMVQVFTYMFLHASFSHLFFNMFALFMFGPWIEYSLGSKRFIFYYISCGIGAALVQEGVFAIMIGKYTSMFSPEQFRQIVEEGADALRHGMNFSDPTLARINEIVNVETVGASGAIYGVLLAYGMLFPETRIYLLIPPIPVKAKWLVIGYGALELLLGLSGRADNVAHFCHLGGMVFGLLIILYWKHKGTFNGRF